MESCLLQMDPVRLLTASCIPFTYSSMVECLIRIQEGHRLKDLWWKINFDFFFIYIIYTHYLELSAIHCFSRQLLCTVVHDFVPYILFVLFYLSYESEGSEVVPVTALRKTAAEWQKNSTKKNSGENKIKSWFVAKDPTPVVLRSQVVYK